MVVVEAFTRGRLESTLHIVAHKAHVLCFGNQGGLLAGLDVAVPHCEGLVQFWRMGRPLQKPMRLFHFLHRRLVHRVSLN